MFPLFTIILYGSSNRNVYKHLIIISIHKQHKCKPSLCIPVKCIPLISNASGPLEAGWLSERPNSNTSHHRTNSSDAGHHLLKGFTSLGLSVIGFGTSLCPIKRTETGDGLFFQLVFSNTLQLGSLIVYWIQGCPTIWMFSLLGGFLFSAGNLTTIPIIRTIGLGMGFLIWSTFSLLTAWATARFGWFGLDQQYVANPTLNYIGTGLATISALISFFIKTTDQLDLIEDNSQPYIARSRRWTEKLSPMNRKIIGCSLATFAGLAYGCSYTPIIYIKNNALRNGTVFSEASQYDLDYIFPYMTGINVTTSMVFFGYCMVMKNRFNLPLKCVLPAFISGGMHFLSQCGFFIACYYLGTVITYPIGAAGPALVSLIWSLFYYKEIRVTRRKLLIITNNEILVIIKKKLLENSRMMTFC
uniref:Transmembrane protein 144 n=1 Tax=Esox lucius TaxID=8010 RepID=A0A3P9A4V0_ESOLU